MDTLLQTFQFGFLLRSLFAGVFFVLSYCMAAGKTNPLAILGADGGNVLAVGLALALIAGVIIYVLHRSLIYPFVEWFLESEWSKRQRKNWCPLVGKNAIGTLAKRMHYQSTEKKKYRYQLAQYINVWLDFVHLQFTAALGIVIGAISGAVVAHSLNLFQLEFPPANLPLFSVFAIFFFAAIVSNWTLHSVLEHLPDQKAPDFSDWDFSYE
jgi:hypothetical protein